LWGVKTPHIYIFQIIFMIKQVNYVYDKIAFKVSSIYVQSRITNKMSNCWIVGLTMQYLYFQILGTLIINFYFQSKMRTELHRLSFIHCFLSLSHSFWLFFFFLVFFILPYPFSETSWLIRVKCLLYLYKL
jgi:hypothetical protein